MDQSETTAKAQIAFAEFLDIDMRVARVLSAPMAEGTRFPCRVMELDLGHLGHRISVGQYALVDEHELVDHNVIACINLGSRKMGPYVSDALVMGAHHPKSPDGQSQATPLHVADDATPGSEIF